ncbi:MAG: hypothetical protein A2792_07250 [Sphingomonadales bacterium RIFCSPHIGHO2_01_FULL_65_20]|jgi:hypothetical protein|uniref:hypothetical protein n=1 Tax=Blastomonas TaxID=150203 RepID=UPI0008315B1A|nr:hypothetical protein [Sphingomonas ursincola]MBA4779274.1 hypothetical protein [Blastomonas sp.]MBY0620944.1 hypothetical protein [Sphingomonas ursincola]MCH2236958.1 hypothetical protein [Blastomonas sp.]OHC91831.1 MAG: hypothetical protein A2792_07250 [Sphingomonadales bacterium RIFCSPHIGHO2_01_FULL_65_20]
MTNPVNDSPSAPATPASTTPVVNTPAPVDGTGVTAAPPAARPHWTVGAWNGASRLITTAANDEMLRNMIGAKARNQVAATVFGGTLMGAIAARVATRSVPGALLVGGALLAKAVYDQRKQKAKPPKP